MRLTGNKKNGRYASGSRRDQMPPANRHQSEQGDDPAIQRANAKTKKSHRVAKILIAILVIILAILVTFYIVLKVGLKPPPVKTAPKPVSSSDVAEASDDQTVPPARDKTKYTFVILGMDDGNGNTDTIMVATFDYKNYSLNVVNIPRDTLVNVSWPTKKVNSLYVNGGIEKVNDGMMALLGYDPDYYVKVDLDAFLKLVDGIGGVCFDVPKDMYYHDPSQNLLIDLKKGPQLLDGAHALQLVRARKNVWSTGDIGRIEMQQAFLKAATGQILEKKNSIKIQTLIDIFSNDVDTNLTALDLVWFAREFFKMDAVNIDFETIPADYYDTVNGDSYCTIKVSDWLNVINTKLNPFDFEVAAEDLSILTRDGNGRLYVTNGSWAGKKSWGSGSSSSASSSAAASPSAKPSTEPPSTSPSPIDSPSSSPSASDALPSPSDVDSSPDISPTETGGDASPSPSPSPSDSAPPSLSGST